MIEKQVQFEILTGNFDGYLVANEGKADPELDEKLTEVAEEPSFQVAFLRFLGQGQEIEVVGVLQKLLRQVGLRRRERCLKVR